MASNLALLTLLATLLAGIRFRGALLGGTFLSFQVGALTSFTSASALYAVGAVGFTLGRNLFRPVQVKPQASDLTFAVLIVLALVSLFWSADFERSAAMIITLLASAGSMYLLGRFQDPREGGKTTRQFAYTLVTAGGIIAVCLLRNRATGTYGAEHRLLLEEGEASAVGLAQPLPFILLSCIAMLLLENRWLFKVLALASMAITSYVAVASGTRSVFLSAALGAGVFLSLSFSKVRSTRNGLIAVAILATLIVITPLIPSNQLTGSLSRLTDNFTGNGISLDRSASDRLELYATAFNLFSSHPLIGTGYGSFGHFGFMDYPHNMFLEIGSALGLSGLVVLSWWLTAGGKAVYVLWRKARTTGAMIAGLMVISFVQMQVSFPFYSAKPLFILIPFATALSAFVVREQGVRRKVNSYNDQSQVALVRPVLPKRSAGFS